MSTATTTAQAVPTVPIRTRAEVETLVQKARKGWQTAEKAITEILECEGWVVMGYKDWPTMYRAEFKDLRLARAVSARVVMSLLKAGASAEQVTRDVPGVGPEVVESVEEQLDNGVPEEAVVFRRKPEPEAVRPAALHGFMVEADVWDDWSKRAAERGMTPEAVMRNAAEVAFMPGNTSLTVLPLTRQ